MLLASGLSFRDANFGDIYSFPPCVLLETSTGSYVSDYIKFPNPNQSTQKENPPRLMLPNSIPRLFPNRFAIHH